MRYKNFWRNGPAGLLVATLILSACGGAGGAGSATTVSTPPSGPVGTQIGGARQGVPLTLTTSVSTFAGGLFYGSADGVGSAAGFSGPVGITTDGTSLFVADTANNLIRRIEISTGAVTTIAGGGSGYNASYSLNYAKPGSLDGTGLAASFSTPNWISSDGTNLYISDQANRKIRKLVIATGAVTTLAGSGVSGSVDGAGSTATFSSPQGITTDGTNLYVVDGSKIRIVSINTGTVSTLALVDTIGATVSLTGVGITTDGSNLYVSDTLTIRKIVIATGVTTVLAGNLQCKEIDGVGSLASFCNPRGITSDGINLYVAGDDSSISGTAAVVRKVVISTGQVTTLAGGGAQWDTNDTGTLAGFRSLNGITTDGVSLFAVDANRVRKIQ